MIVLAVSCAALITVALTVSLCAGLIRAQQRSAARERDLLLNQLLHLSGRPWQPSPADTWTPQTDEERIEASWHDAEQDPVY